MASVFETRSFRLLALANVGGVGVCAAALLTRPSPEEARREAALVREELAALQARCEAARRAVRLATTVATVALDYKVAQWRGESGAVLAAQAELRAAQDEQEAAGLAVERAADDEARQRGLAAARQARSRVLSAAAALAATRAQEEEDSKNNNLHSRNARRLLAMARANGGCYVKFAQHASQLDYMVPDEYLEVFASCLDDAPRSTFADVQRVLREELGGTCDELFEDFEREPIASASLAQVHRATFRGRTVAVKVQHRGLRETSRGDLEACALATRLVARFFPEFRLGWLVDEIAPHLPVELDFRVEARNCERAKRQFSRWRDVRVPDVVPERSSARVFTMTFEPGVNGADRAKVAAAGVDARKAAALAVRAFAASIFSYGFVHCDPHSANLLFAAKKNGAPLLVLLDHGLYRELDDAFRLEYARLWRSIVLADTPGIAASAQRLGVGDLYPLFAAMLARRPWDDVANPDLASLAPGDAHGDAELLRGYAHRYAKEITLVLDRVPRQMLLLLKMSDCLRHLELSLLHAGGGNEPSSAGINSHVITAHACADALFAHDRDFRAFARVKLRLWAYDLRQRFFSRSSTNGVFSPLFFFRRQRQQQGGEEVPFVAVPEHVSQFATTA